MDQRVRKRHGIPNNRERRVLLTILLLCYTETHGPQQEQDQPAPLPPLSPDRRTAEEEVEDGTLDLILAYTHSEDLGMAFGVYKRVMFPTEDYHMYRLWVLQNRRKGDDIVSRGKMCMNTTRLHK
jgi:hypothetical protein